MGKASWELQHCNTATQCCRLTDFGGKFLLPFPSVVKKNQKKLTKNSWTAMTMLYLCTRKIEHAPACNRRSLSFESEVLCRLLLGKWERIDLSRQFPSRSQSGWDSWRRKQRENKRQKTHIRSLTDLHTQNKSPICSVMELVEFTLICDN